MTTDQQVPYDMADPLAEILAAAPREATALRQRLLDRGYVILPVPRDGDSLHGVSCWDDPETLLSLFVSWLGSKGQLVDPPAGTVDDDLYDVVLHFLSEQREAARTNQT